MGGVDFPVTQTEQKLFRMAKRGSTTVTWKLASAALLVIALCAGAFGYVQYNTVRTLNAQLAEVTAEANQAAAEDTRLRSQLSAVLDRINSQATKLTASAQQVDAEQHELDAVQQQTTAEQQQLVAARQQVTQEQQQLAAAERQVQEEKRKLQDAQAQLAAESRPDLPVRLLFFDAARPGAKVAVLQNLSNTELDVTLDVQSPGNNEHARKQLVLAARGVLRMGPAQGWAFTPGQVVTLDSTKFRRIVQTVS
jgi:small-conductance mechanosensitive channel